MEWRLAEYSGPVAEGMNLGAAAKMPNALRADRDRVEALIGRLSSLQTLAILDEIARLKQTDAIDCDAANLRISDRVLERFGWEPHRPSKWHRNFIKRFYGVYPEALRCDSRLVSV